MPSSSGVKGKEKVVKPVQEEEEEDKVEEQLEEQSKESKEEKKPPEKEKKIEPPKYPVKVPFPQRLHKKHLDEQFSKFLETFKKVSVNLPLVEALQQMPTYVKFLKDIISKKRKITEYETVCLTEECSAIVQQKLPAKLKDPGSFTITCVIGTEHDGRALCDLGASINLMPLLIFNRL